MQIESRRLLQMQQKEARQQVTLTSVGTLNAAFSSFQSSMSSFRSASAFSNFSVTSSATGVLEATASSSAAAGTHSVLVRQLARAETRKSDTGYSATTDVVGTGTLTIQLGSGASVDVTVDSGSQTLAGIRDAINGSDAEVTASLLHDGTDYHLVLTGDEMGSANAISVSGSGGLSGFTFTQTQAALNAIIDVDGITDINKETNNISDVIQGVTLDLKTVDAVNPVTVNVAQDTSRLKQNVLDFVSAANKLFKSLNDLTYYDSGTGASGPFQGDSSVRVMSRNVHQVISGEVPGLSAGLAAKLLELAPPLLIYVSCDPATLSRDLTRLGAGFKVCGARMVDMFPQTSEIETVVRLERS